MSEIEWTDVTWNPVVGCSRVSAGCDHCYAMGVAHRKMSPQHVGLTKLRPKDAKRPGVDWIGEVRFLPERLAEPMRWRKPRRVFVNSMSDLFHGKVTNEQIAAVFGVMAVCPQHTFQVLTKRPARAAEWFQWASDATAFGLVGELDHPRAIEHALSLMWRREQSWPLPNVHLGVSVEDQATADERIPALIGCPAAVRWVSYEPALGAVDFKLPRMSAARVDWHLDWIVVGGESGPGARPFDVAWARSTIEQGRAAGVPVFVKQLGADVRDVNDGELLDRWPETLDVDAIEHNPNGIREEYQGAPVRVRLQDRKGGDTEEWPEALRVREWPQ